MSFARRARTHSTRPFHAAYCAPDKHAFMRGNRIGPNPSVGEDSNAEPLGRIRQRSRGCHHHRARGGAALHRPLKRIRIEGCWPLVVGIEFPCCGDKAQPRLSVSWSQYKRQRSPGPSATYDVRRGGDLPPRPPRPKVNEKLTRLVIHPRHTLIPTKLYVFGLLSTRRRSWDYQNGFFINFF